MPDPVFLKNEEFIWSTLGDEAVLLNVSSGDYFGLNEVGLSFWEKIDGQRPLTEIVAMMLDEYEVDRMELMHDLAELASEMASKGLLKKRS